MTLHHLLYRFLTDRKPKAAKVTYINRLTPAVYADLVGRVGGNTLVTHQTTELQAGFQLGVQHALRVVREGFVSDT